MPLCGFNEKMLDGLEAFYKGLAEAVLRKSEEKNIAVEEAIIIELKDMDDFLRELLILGDDLNKHKLIGITNYAKAFYLGSLKLAKDKKVSIEEAMNTEIKETRTFLFEVDEHFYEHLESKKENPMFELVKWIQGRNS